MEAAIAEASENMVDSAAVNSDLTWIPNLGIALVALALVATIVVVWLSPRATFRTKVTRTITSLAWSALSIALLGMLSAFASSLSVSGASALFVISSVSAAFLGVSALVSRTRNMLSSEDARLVSAASESVPNASAFWGTVDKPVIQVSLDDNDSQMPRKETSSSDSNSRIPLPARSLRESSGDDGWGGLVFRIFTTTASWLVSLLVIAGVSALSFVFLEMPSNASFLSIPETYMACELSIIACAVAGSWFIFQRRPVGLLIPLLVAAVYGTAEYFVESFKASAIPPADLRSAGTGMSVAGGYEYELTSAILLVITLFCLAAGAIAWLGDPLSRFLSRKEYMVGSRWKGKFLSRIAAKKQRREDIVCIVKNAAAAVISLLLGIQLVLMPIAPAMETDWEEEGVVFDYWQMHTSIDNFGIIPSFVAALQLEDIEAPSGYDHSQAEQLQTSMSSLYDQYISSSPGYQEAATQFESVKPNVILVMNESFVDMSYLGGLGVGYEGLPYLRNLETIGKGQASVSVYGGGTCNSEFESLTGTSLGYIGGGISPYALYDLSRIDSIPKQFKALGYSTTGIHPEVATNWGRDKVYPELGFDEFIDADSFEDADRLREHVRDFETYDMAIDKIVSSDEPQFIFDLTMANHGGYETGLIPETDSVNYDFENSGVLDSLGNSIANEYLSSVRMSDRDTQHLIYKLSEIDEPTVVVFFGDHHPGFSWWFQEGYADRTDDIAYQESMYQTDWFVWANYPISGTAWNPQTAASANMPSPVIQVDMPQTDAGEETMPVQELDAASEPEGFYVDVVGEEPIAGGVETGEQVEGNQAVLPDLATILGPVDVYTRQMLEEVAGNQQGEPQSTSESSNPAEPVDDWYPDLGGGSTLYTGTMSPANLMGWSMTFIGAPLTNYEKASYMSRFWVQSNNIYGYMDASGRWHPMEAADSISSSAVFEDGMRIVESAAVSGLPGIDAFLPNGEIPDDAVIAESGDVSDTPNLVARQYQDAVMVNVMRWITYMNFAELLK